MNGQVYVYQLPIFNHAVDVFTTVPSHSKLGGLILPRILSVTSVGTLGLGLGLELGSNLSTMIHPSHSSLPFHIFSPPPLLSHHAFCAFPIAL